MKKLLSSLIVFLIASSLFATDGKRNIGARSTGIAGVGVSFHDLWSVFNNQAGLAFVTKKELGFAYENRFNLNELSLRSFAFALPTNSGVLGLGYTSYGFSDYAESKIGVSYGLQVGENIAIGGQINYQSITQSSVYGDFGTVSGEIGLLANITPELMVGAQVSNPVKVQLTEGQDEELLSTMAFGAVYEFSEKVLATAEVEKQVDRDAGLRFGIEYGFNEKILLRAGAGTGPTKVSFGFGYLYNNLRIDAAVWHHQTLGFSPSISASYSFGKSL